MRVLDVSMRIDSGTLNSHFREKVEIDFVIDPRNFVSFRMVVTFLF